MKKLFMIKDGKHTGGFKEFDSEHAENILSYQTERGLNDWSEKEPEPAKKKKVKKIEENGDTGEDKE